MTNTYEKYTESIRYMELVILAANDKKSSHENITVALNNLLTFMHNNFMDPDIQEIITQGSHPDLFREANELFTRVTEFDHLKEIPPIYSETIFPIAIMVYVLQAVVPSYRPTREINKFLFKYHNIILSHDVQG